MTVNQIGRRCFWGSVAVIVLSLVVLSMCSCQSSRPPDTRPPDSGVTNVTDQTTGSDHFDGNVIGQ